MTTSKKWDSLPAILFSDPYYTRASRKFWGRVDKRGATQCWPWTGAISKTGYGTMRLPFIEGMFLAHRLAYMLSGKRPIPSGIVVGHTCDVRNCCNPSHLEAGTQMDNIHDAIQRKRLVLPKVKYGPDNWNAKLTKEQANYISSTFVPGARKGTGSAGVLASKFGISPVTVRRIAKGRTWHGAVPCSNPKTQSLPPDRVVAVVSRYERNGKRGPNSRLALAREFGIAPWALDRIVAINRETIERNRHLR